MTIKEAAEKLNRDYKLYCERKLALEKLRNFLTPEEYKRIDKEINFWLELHIE